MRKNKSVRVTIFRSFTLLILASVAVSSAFFYIYVSRILRDRAISVIADTARSLARSTDGEISKMSNISLNVSGSALLKRLFAERASFAAGLSPDEAKRQGYLRTRELTDIMVTIIGPLKPVPQVNLYGLAGGAIGAGIASGELRRSLAEQEWAADLDLRSGSKLVTAPRRDPLLDDTFPLYRERSYVSLCRALFDGSGIAVGVVEVKQFYDELFKDFAGRAGYLAVVDRRGRQLYPHAPAGDGGWGAVAERLDGGRAASISVPGMGRRATAAVAECRQIDWRVIVARDEAELMRPLADFVALSATAGILVLGLSAAVASRLASSITVPLGRLRSELSALDWEALAAGGRSAPKAGLGELEELEAAFAGMRRKLGESARDALEARTHELRATMLALQSQMDPHFIYNMLTTIGIMAEERMHDPIHEAIGHMTHLLRYISSGASSYVPLSDEIEYTRRYLACMKIRFGDDLDYSISLPPALAGIVVPKLVIQPLVENCMKYGIDREPPWLVSVEVVDRGAGWAATIRDDGPGFPGEVLASLADLRPAVPGGAAEGLGIGGLGLRNIAARLRLYYGEAAVFAAENGPSGGARVTIGGSRGDGEKV